MTRQELRVEERRAAEMAPGWVVWANHQWRTFRAFGEPWRHVGSGCTGPTALFELGAFVSLVETFAAESTVLRLVEQEDELEDALDAASHAIVREQAAAVGLGYTTGTVFEVRVTAGTLERCHGEPER